MYGKAVCVIGAELVMEDERTRSGVGRLIRERRNVLGISQPQLADQTGIPQRTISRIENTTEEGYLPESRLLVPLATALGLRMADLVRAAGYPVEGAENDAPEPDEVQVFTSMMHDVDRLQLPERVKRIMRETIQYARELSEREEREP